MTSDELNNLRVLAANWLALVGPAGAWRARFADVIDAHNETLFDPAELALLRAIDSLPRVVTVDGVVAEVAVGRCECRPCTEGCVESGHCIDWHDNRIHACAALEAMDDVFGAASGRSEP